MEGVFKPFLLQVRKVNSLLLKVLVKIRVNEIEFITSFLEYNAVG